MGLILVDSHASHTKSKQNILSLNWVGKGQLILKCLLIWCLQFSKNERKQVDLRYLSSKVEFFRSFFGRIEDTKKTFRN